MIRTIIADDHPVVREGLKRILGECDDIRVVGEAVNGPEVLAACGKKTVDVLLLDITMPQSNFLETMKLLKDEFPDLKILVLSVHSEDSYAVRSLRAGASGYLTKDHSPEELEKAIRDVFKGKMYATPAVTAKLVDALDPKRQRPPHESLSNREFQTLRLIGTGKQMQQIAAELGVSPKTVSTYRTRILRKLSLENNAQLIRYVIENGLLD